MARRTDSGRGFTLVEMLIVLGVVALLAVIAVPGLAGISGAHAREAAGGLSSSMRALFDLAALRSTTCCVALDVEHRAWWADCGLPRAAGPRPPAPAGALAPEGAPEAQDTPACPALARGSARVAERSELPGSARFGAVQLEGQRDAVEKGIAYVHFFPGGQAQRAVVPVIDGNHQYSIVVEPFTGRSRVVIGPVELRE